MKKRKVSKGITPLIIYAYIDRYNKESLGFFIDPVTFWVHEKNELLPLFRLILDRSFESYEEFNAYMYIKTSAYKKTLIYKITRIKSLIF